jgi:RimJ/RimL family protein N-acetyltransferase
MPPSDHRLPPDLEIRPIRASDKDALLDLFERLSPQSRFRRFLAPKPRMPRRELAYLTEVDHRAHEALVAVDADGAFVGVARYACGFGETEVADVAFAVADAWQGRGIARELARRLTEHARRSGITRLHATTLPDNRPARRLLAGAGFQAIGIDGGVLELELDLMAGNAGAGVRRAA